MGRRYANKHNNINFPPPPSNDEIEVLGVYIHMPVTRAKINQMGFQTPDPANT